MRNELVSVIIPTRNSAATIEGCLKSIREQSYPNIEIIVVDNNSSDNTKEIAKKYTDKIFNKGPERSAQRNFGVKKSKGQSVLIIDSDMELTPHVIAACNTEIRKNNKIKAVVIPEESFGVGFWAQCKKFERSFYIGVDWIEAARFFTRDVFLELGGYDERITGVEDFDLPQRISEEYGRDVLGRINELIYHNEQKLSLIKTCKKKFYYAGQLNIYRNDVANRPKFSKQANPLNRYKLFLQKPKSLLQNPLCGLGMFFMKACEFASGAAGYLTSKTGQGKDK